MCIYIYIDIYVYMHMYVYIGICMYIRGSKVRGNFPGCDLRYGPFLH